MRIIKTTLAVTFSAYLAVLLGLDSPFLAATAALLTLQGSLGDSFNVAMHRILGTVFGAVIGIAGAYLAQGNPLVLGVGTGLIIYLAHRLRWHKAIIIATIVFASIMLEGSESITVMAGLNRVIDTMAGIVVAVVVNFSISRPHSHERVVKIARDFVSKCKVVVGMHICQEEGVSLTEIADKLKIIEGELPAVKAELRLHISRASRDLNFDAIKADINELYQHIAVLARLECQGQFTENNAELISKMYGVTMSVSEELAETEVVYNYHLGRIIELIESLSLALKLSSPPQPAPE